MVDLGLLVLRVAVGLVIAAHGAQKLFGWFGGYGLQGTGIAMGSMGLRPGTFWALLGGASEFGGGVLLALGLLSPLGSLGVLAAMLTAISLAHWPRFFASDNGMEYPLVIALAALALGLVGPGNYALDAFWGTALPQPIFFMGLIAVLLGVAVPTVMAAGARRAPTPIVGEEEDQQQVLPRAA